MPLLIFQIVLWLFCIVGCCSLFTNAIEWVGHRFKLSEGAVGSVFAAVGTALPETLVPIIAIVSGVLGLARITPSSGSEIGIGAILGAPFLLGTLAMFVTGMALWICSALKKRTFALQIDSKRFRRDFHYFFPAYSCVFMASFIPVPAVKIILAIALPVFYGLYVYRTLKSGNQVSCCGCLTLGKPNSEVKMSELEVEGDLPPLAFSSKTSHPKTGIILIQLAFSLSLLLIFVHYFVDSLSAMATLLRIQPLLLSLIITPIATELPEKFNSVLWIHAQKDTLALGNITGSMVFQSCIATIIGLLCTPWHLGGQGIFSVVLCLLSAGSIYLVAWKKPQYLSHSLLGCGGLFYLLFICGLLWIPFK